MKISQNREYMSADGAEIITYASLQAMFDSLTNCTNVAGLIAMMWADDKKSVTIYWTSSVPGCMVPTVYTLQPK